MLGHGELDLAELEGKTEVSSSLEVLVGVRKGPEADGPNVMDGDDACGGKRLD